MTDRQLSEDNDHLNASSELSLDSPTSSLSIRSTRTSRLRAAAAIQDSSKKARSSSVTSLVAPEDAKNRTIRSARGVEREKRFANRKQSREEKENVKASTVQKDNGANKTKPKHSIVKLDKDKSKILVISPKRKEDNLALEKVPNGDARTHFTEVKNEVVRLENSFKVKGEEILEELLNGSAEKDQCENLFNDLLENNFQDAVTLNLNDGVPDNLAVSFIVDGLNTNSQKVHVYSSVPKNVIKENALSHGDEMIIPTASALHDVVIAETPQATTDTAKDIVSVMPVDEQFDQLSVKCVRKVSRFSELLSNLCSPYEADLLFEDMLAEEGRDSKEDTVSYT